MREISITELENLKIGQAENAQAGTGCTVFLLGKTVRPWVLMCAAVARPRGRASCSSPRRRRRSSTPFCWAAAPLLDAAGGVMRYLEERGIGFDVGVTKVPLVCQSDLFDLTVGDAHTRPDAAMAYQACVNAETGNYRDGNYGAGTGATVGKLLGMPHCMKSGIGSYAVQVGPLQVGAVVAVNALGDIYDWRTGRKAAGLLADDGKTFLDSEDVILQQLDAAGEKFVGNTTIGAVFTNAKFDKAHLCKIAAMTHDGYARAIRPVHTANDGDSIYAVSLGDLAADQDVVGALAARVMAEAILRAVQAADSAYGFPAAKDLKR